MVNREGLLRPKTEEPQLAHWTAPRRAPGSAYPCVNGARRVSWSGPPRNVRWPSGALPGDARSGWVLSPQPSRSFGTLYFELPDQGSFEARPSLGGSVRFRPGDSSELAFNHTHLPGGIAKGMKKQILWSWEELNLHIPATRLVEWAITHSFNSGWLQARVLDVFAWPHGRTTNCATAPLLLAKIILFYSG